MRKNISISILVIAVVLLVGVVGFLLLDHPRITRADIPLYPDAQKIVFEGAFEIPLDLVASNVHLALRERYSPADNEIYTLPPGADWDAIRRFYAGQLESDGWRLDDDLTRRQHPKYEMAVWKRGLLNRQAVAVTLIPQPGGVDNDYLLISITR